MAATHAFTNFGEGELIAQEDQHASLNARAKREMQIRYDEAQEFQELRAIAHSSVTPVAKAKLPAKMRPKNATKMLAVMPVIHKISSKDGTSGTHESSADAKLSASAKRGREEEREALPEASRTTPKVAPVQQESKSVPTPLTAVSSLLGADYDSDEDEDEDEEGGGGEVGGS